MNETQSQTDNGHSRDENQVRDYELNFEKAVRKKARACNVEYLVSGH